MKKTIFLLLWLLGAFAPAGAQQKDSAAPPQRFAWFRKLYHSAWLSVQREKVDSGEFWQRQPEVAEEAFKFYEGKTIRHITVVQLDFDHQLLDTATRVGSTVSRVASRLHVTTKDWALFNHLFIKEGEPLNAYQVADNERFLRTLSFIQDVRILPAPVGPNGFASDSVDLVVVSKDVFSLGGDLLYLEAQRIGLRGYDANFLGMGQRLQATLIHDLNRHPRTGFDLSISRSSLGGSFINGGVGFTNINTGRSTGGEEESAGFLRLERPLVSPDAKYAGGLELSINQSNNFYRKPESLFYDYRYNVADVWAGVNFTANTEAYRNDRARRQRVFIALRYLQNDFTHLPWQVGTAFDPIYNSQRGVLASATLFRLNYYRTRYFYGFGLTEDLPKGHKVTGTAGWYRQNGVDRPYAGIDFLRYSATPSGKYLQTYLRAGSFLRNQQPEDAGILIGATAYSRIYQPGLTRFRQRFSASFALLHNRTGIAPLRIDNTFGLLGYGTDSILGTSRLNFWSESLVFLRHRLYGFRAAPFVFGGFTVIAPGKEIWKQSNVYTGVGGGLRVRNENLIFGTIEARFTFFPRTEYGVAPFHFNLVSNLRFRYRSTYVQAPQVFQLNEEIL